MFGFMIHTPAGWETLLTGSDHRELCEYADRWAAANPSQRIRVCPAEGI